METCLITGAKGLVGSFLLKELEKEYKIILFEGDLTDPHFCDALPKKLDMIIHLAQSRHFKEFPVKSLDIFAVNTFSTLQLLDYGRRIGVKKFIYASSGVVYGTGSKPFVETDALQLKAQLGAYYASKLSSEILVENYSAFFTTVILRFFFVYGPGQKDNMLIPRLVQSVHSGKPIQLQGSEGIRINPIYAQDAARAIQGALCLENSEKINVAGNEIISLKETGEIIGDYLGIKPHFENDWAAIPGDLIADTEKMQELLGIPQTNFRNGLKAYLESQCLKI